EGELGVPLFERTTRSVSLTPAGEAMLEAARRSTAAADEAFQAARLADRGEYAQTVRIEMGSGVLQTAAQLAERVRRDHPSLPLQYTSMGVMRGLAALLEGRLEVVLGLASQTAPAIRAELVRREPLLVAVGADHPLARRDTVSVAQLNEYELLLPSEESGSEWNQFISIVCAHAGVGVRRSPSTVHGATVTAGLLRESAVVLPTLRWADPPSGIAFRPLVEPELSFPWSMMTSRISRAGVQTLLHSVLELAHEQNWLSRDGLSPPSSLRVDRASAA